MILMYKNQSLVSFVFFLFKKVKIGASVLGAFTRYMVLKCCQNVRAFSWPLA